MACHLVLNLRTKMIFLFFVGSSDGTGDCNPEEIPSTEWWYWDGFKWKQTTDSRDVIVQNAKIKVELEGEQRCICL